VIETQRLRNFEIAMTRQAPRPKNCPVCETKITERFLRLKNIPVNCSALFYTEQQARTTARGDIDLAVCKQCGMIFNAAFDASRLEYDLTYDNTLSYSPSFRQYAQGLAKRLVSSYDLNGKDIIEVGCGDGEFLNHLCRLGGNRGKGYDPSATTRNEPGVPEIISRMFGPSEEPGHFVCCRHVLEHIDTPREVLMSVRNCLLVHNGRAYFEVPNINSVLGGPTTWDIIYPHCLYFSVPSLRYLFEASGFEVTRLESTFGGQFLGIDAKIAEHRQSVRAEARSLAAVVKLADRFEARLQENIFRWSRFIEYASVEGRRIVLWGAGAKGVTFLNIVPGAERILAVVDLNPRKHGAFVPGTAQSVISPEALTAVRPDVVIVLNPLYQAEIQRSLTHLGINALVTVEPHLPLPSHVSPLKRATAV
jgi:SAM-dependent methyltransferase